MSNITNEINLLLQEQQRLNDILCAKLKEVSDKHSAQLRTVSDSELRFILRRVIGDVHDMAIDGADRQYTTSIVLFGGSACRHCIKRAGSLSKVLGLLEYDANSVEKMEDLEELRISLLNMLAKSLSALELGDDPVTYSSDSFDKLLEEDSDWS